MMNQKMKPDTSAFFAEETARLPMTFLDDVRAWKRQLVQGILRSTVVVAILVLVVGSYYAYSVGVWWQIPLYIILVSLWVLMAFLPKVPYALRAWSLLALIYAVSILDFLESGRTGSARVFLIALPMLGLLLFNVRAGVLTLGVSLLTLAGFGWLYAAGRLSVLPEIASSTRPAIWWSNSAVFFFIAVLLMASANYLINRLSRVVINLEASVKKNRDLLSLQQAVLDAATDGILAVDHAGKITTVNRRFAEMWDIAEPVMASQNDEAAIASVLDQLKDPAAFMDRIKELYEHPQDKSDDLLELKDGRVLERYSRPQWLGDEIIGRVWAFRDITAQKQAEETFKRSQRNFDLFFNTIDDLLFVLDVQGNIIHINQTVCRKLGYTEAELIGQPVLAVHPPERQAEAGRIVAEMLAGKAEFCPVPVVTKDGRQVPVETRVVAGEWDGRPALFGVTRDISQLKLSEEKFSRAFNSGLVLTSISTVAEGRYLDVNEAFLNVMGLTRQQVIGKTSIELNLFVNPQDRETIRRQFVETGQVQNVEVQMRGKDGAIVWGLFCFTPIQVGAEPCWLTTMTDITDRVCAEAERRKAEESLAQERNLLRAVVDAMSSVVFAKDVQGRKILSNAGDQRAMGVRSEAEALGKTDWDIYPPKVAAGYAAQDKLVLEDGQVFESESSFIDSTGQRRWMFGSKQPFRNQAGEIIGLVGVFHDITPVKQAEAEREKLIAELETKNAELERFTYTVSHDLKSPLITIKAFLGFLEKDLAGGHADRVRHDVELIAGAADKMQRLLSELLELSRIGRLMNPSEEVSFANIAGEAIELVHGRIEARGVEVEIAPDLPVVYGDRARLVEAIQNLVDNACKFMGDQPHPRIEIGARHGEDGPVFTVRDNGMGIEPRYHTQIFDLFEKLDPNSEGTGIGLALVKRIVETHGGRIWVESEPGQGTTFCLTIPPGHQ